MERTWTIDEHGNVGGYVEKTASTKLGDGTEHVMTFRFTLTGLTVEKLIADAVKPWVIAAQRPVRACPANDVREMKRWETSALTPGAKPMTRTEKIAAVMAATNMPEKLAIMSIDHPEQYAELMAQFS